MTETEIVKKLFALVESLEYPKGPEWQDLRDAVKRHRQARRGLARDLVTVDEYNHFARVKGWALALGRDQQPVTNVSWFRASMYCQWVGGRLPTTDELSKAEIGVLADWSRWPLKELPDVGASGVVSPDGTRDILGVIYQWTSTAQGFGQAYQGQAYQGQAYQGGSWNQRAEIARVRNFGASDPGLSAGLLGFRVFFQE